MLSRYQVWDPGTWIQSPSEHPIAHNKLLSDQTVKICITAERLLKRKKRDEQLKGESFLRFGQCWGSKKNTNFPCLFFRKLKIYWKNQTG